MRLIDADALLEELKKTYKYFDLKFYIEDAPTIKPSGGSGVFIPDISVEQLRNASLEGVEELLAEGVMRDVLADRPTAEPSKSTDQNVADVPIGETISKAKVLALINKAMYNTDNKDIQDYIFNGLRRDVHHLPSADRPQVNSAEWVEQKEREFEELNRPKGEWIENDVLGWKCSKCGIITNLESNFCPCCGADMRPEK